MRGIPSAESLSADVEGDIEEADGTMKITRIRIRYHLTHPAGTREKVDRALANYAEKCPAYQSVKDSIECTWELHAEEG